MRLPLWIETDRNHRRGRKRSSLGRQKEKLRSPRRETVLFGGTMSSSLFRGLQAGSLTLRPALQSGRARLAGKWGVGLGAGAPAGGARGCGASREPSTWCGAVGGIGSTDSPNLPKHRWRPMASCFSLRRLLPFEPMS